MFQNMKIEQAHTICDHQSMLVLGEFNVWFKNEYIKLAIQPLCFIEELAFILVMSFLTHIQAHLRALIFQLGQVWRWASFMVRALPSSFQAKTPIVLAIQYWAGLF